MPAAAEFCPHCGTRTPTQISGGGTTAVAMPPDQLAEQQVRLQAALGADYAVERLIGSGGFAAVWAAFDRKLQREVAVKVLHPDLVATRSLVERFQREAQAVAKLRHPGVIPIFAVGEHEGLAFYIMPLVEGESLRERLSREGPLAPDEVRRILREASGALAAAHRAGIVHRDIKPENLMLEGSERRVVVMDFGIAKSTAGAAQTGLTGTGMIIGTPAYMSPEQATGSKEIDVRSDVYSLGVVGFEMLAGRPPFKAASVPELIMEHVTTPAPSVASVRADTPEDLAVAVNRCLQKEPKERWKNAGDLSGFLERVSTPTAQRGAVSKDLRRFARRGWRPSRRQVFWATVGAAAVVAAVLLGVSPARMRVSFYYWANKVGLAKSAPPPPATANDVLAPLKGAPGPWALANRSGGNVYAVQSMGGTYLAVSEVRNTLFALRLFDGQTWRSFRTPEPIGAVAQAGKELLLFGMADGGHMYRWSPAGIAQVDTIPFGARAAWADERNVVLVGEGAGQLAARDARGWHRIVSLRRTPLVDVAGTAANDLAALGVFGSENGDRPDSILEFDGTSWESVDPRPAGVKEAWIYDAIRVLGDGSLVVGGHAGNQPLLLIRSSRGHWRRIPLKVDSAATVKDIWGIWGSGPDDLVVWNGANCVSCRLAEVRRGEWSESAEMGKGMMLGAAAAGGVPYAVWADGTVWARRNGRWVFATEVPSAGVSYVATLERPDFLSLLRLGNGAFGYAFSDRLGSADVGRSALDSVPGDGRGVAVGRRLGWVLGADGAVRRIDCRANPCTVARETYTGGLALVERRRGGALLVGARGLVALSSELGQWRRVPVPAAVAGESLLSGDESADGRLAVLGSQHLVIVDSLGRGLRTENPAGPGRALGVAMTDKGYVALVYRDRAVIERPDGTPIGFCSGSYPIASWLALADGRLVFGLAGDPGDPFAGGALLVAAPDSSGVPQRMIHIAMLRSRVTAMFERGGSLTIYTTSGVLERSLQALPFGESGQRSDRKSVP